MWNTLTDAELRQAIHRIVNQCTTKEQVNAKAKEELDYPYHIAVTYSKPNRAGQRMSMFMAYSKDGEILS